MNISKISIKICSWMNHINHRSEEENKVIQYGLELLLDNLLKFLLIEIVGILIGKGWQTLIILFSFCGLRLQAGGKHAKTGIGCGLSMIVIWAISILCDSFYKINLILLGYIYMVCCGIVVLCAPRTINIEYFTLQEKRKKKLFSFAFLTALLLIAAGIPEIRGLIVYPVILEAVTLLPKNKIKKESNENEKGNYYKAAGKVN